MSTPAQIASRDLWRQHASDLARLDCELVGLLPMTEPRAVLSQLPPDVFAALTRKLSALVDWACEQERAFRTQRAILHGLTRRIWHFAKSLNPNLEPFGDY